MVITPDGTLIAGERRLAAVRSLGWVDVPVRVVDLDEIVRGEFDENTVRKDFNPSEIAAIAKALRPKEEAEAKERQSRKVSGTGEETRDRIARRTGVSGRTVEKIEAVVEAAERDALRTGAAEGWRQRAVLLERRARALRRGAAARRSRRAQEAPLPY